MDRADDVTSAETVALGNLGAAPRKTESAAATFSSVSSIAEEGRFVPGALLGGRYRIIALLGRGGMGEVYQATDLMLGQYVALKFLPEEASRNQRLLERFHGEVRVARQVSHPNVCRVYDIGEVEGTPFISMEYVDGEDLASLLTRIGRLPADKATETARKLCAGLAAAHDRGVIHRDLKPQNIMMNKRGEVVIMDFGLAAIAGQLSGAEVRNGTPAYMAPEQLKGAEVTARSDIYSLGLVLYELFTGKRPFEAKTVRHMLELQEAAQLSSMTSIAADIDPAVEKVIRRCLDPDPAKRPATPLSVLAALPGGDPLAAALAAGETPSPEMVAASGETEGLARRYSIPCLIAIVLCLFGATVVRGSRDAMMHAPLDYSPEMLTLKSREVAASLGFAKRPADTAISLGHRTGLLGYLAKLPQPRKWDEWLASESPILADYRESLEPMIAQPKGTVTVTNPPPISPGMSHARLDGAARLREFSAVPYGAGEELKDAVPPEAVFRAAGLDISKFTEAAPEIVPQEAADQLRAWRGPHPKIPGMELRVQIAWWKGRITQVEVLFPWDKTGNTGKQGQSLAATLRQLYPLLIVTAPLLFAALVARRNWKAGRIDRRGALLVAGASFLLDMVGWIGDVHAVPSDDMIGLFQRAAGEALFSAALVWVVYLALEPSVRARWPHSIVTWNRVLAGRWLDPLVASHILIGAAAGSGIWMIFNLVEAVLGQKDVLGIGGSLYVAMGARQWIAGFAFIWGHAITIGLVGFFAIFGLRQLVRKDWAAAIVAAVLFTFVESGVRNSDQMLVAVAIYLSVYAILIFMLLRFGLVATISAVCFINGFNGLLLGLDWKTWYAPSGVATLLLMLGLVFLAFWRSLGSRGLLGSDDAAGA